ncbi:MAG: O-antigen ligase family protein, partial [Candidatus Omnitrophica bacterium]|nr:O-antigen ligase family protein [Candidatus Omnitrophota bacterium]
VKQWSGRLILGTFLSPFLFLLYLANTRSAWLGFFASFLFVLFVRSRKLFKILVSLLAIIAILAFFAPKEKTGNLFGMSSLQDRFYMWHIGWKIFKKHPIIGSGLNMGFHEFQEYREDKYRGKQGSYFHNGFLQIAVETGIIGLIAFLLILWKAFISTFRYVRAEKDDFKRTFSLGLLGGLAAFLIHSFFDTNLQSLPLAALFWSSLAFLIAAQKVNA